MIAFDSVTFFASVAFSFSTFLEISLIKVSNAYSIFFPSKAEVSQKATLYCSAFFSTSATWTSRFSSKSDLLPTNNIRTSSLPFVFNSPIHLSIFSKVDFLVISYTTKAPFEPL